ncbi:MAG: 1-acyl-sn-glycerol-3-phosphate acyltransferase [Anaerolineae bacterium]|nr:1-acyl-sn-glycerol-3-phosphate acyltransferase [Anaerolineae bacterium]
MNLTARFGNVLIHTLATLTIKIGPFPLDQIPEKGPHIIIFNHVNFIDGPVLLNRLASRPVAIMAKIETWKNPLFGAVLDGWDGIAVRRGEADLEAFRKAQQVLTDGKILIISPEGTRSEYKGLVEGHAGVLLLAARSGASIQAVGLSQHRGFWSRLYRGFKRVPLEFHVGKPFKLELNGAALSRDVRQKATDEIMYQLAAVLPPEYRGIYADLSKASWEYIRPL